MSDAVYWLWIQSRDNITPARVNAIMGHFGEPSEIYSAQREEYMSIPGLSRDFVDSLCDKKLDRCKRIIDDCEAKKIKIITREDTAYPTRLKHIYYPPLALYVLGELPDMDNEAAIAFVGTRKCTEYGIAATDRIAGEIARGGGLIVSGMALGIDSASHEAALRAGAKTVAVFGCGVDLCYPSEKKKLRLRIIENGAIISEYPPETSPDKTHFPARNRIISGISLGVVIAEAPEHRSGALITAACAAEQGRDVYAIPGNITSLQSVGTNQLIRDGAKPALCGADILNEYEAAFPQKINMQRAEEREIPTIQTLSDEKLASFKPNEQAILTAIMAGRKQIDEIIENTKQEAPCVLSVLTVLEITGVVRQTPGKIFEICV